ncbi:MAG: response regulator [Candidatus Melainabacteria bacterium]|nr:response regulator [Candidatus Melainabacteria bacterium]
MSDKIAILLVEDTPSDIRLTEEALKRSDLSYDLSVVNDGEEAMEYLGKAKKENTLPDLILLDLNMPRKNGHEVLADIKEDAELRKIPVVLLTVSQRDEDVMEALKLKMNYYLAKPITAQTVSVLVKAIHELHRETASPEGSNEETHIRLVLAGNPHTAAVVLEQLALDADSNVRRRLAENSKISGSLLEKLAGDQSAEVRLSVCENANVTEAILEKLARDPSDDVRLGLSENRSLPERILKVLADDENVFVSASASKTLAELSRA